MIDYLEELERGTRLESRGRTITEADLVSFSALTGDWHPQHADATWAARSRFGERIAHGMLVISYAIGLLGLDPERVVALRSIRDAVFKRPVRIGDTIRVGAEIVAAEPLDDEVGLVEVAVRVRDQESRLVARATLEAVWRRRPREAGDPASNGAAFADQLSPVRDGMVLT
jgi:3-hydroxybutyryl-CoA dehydratase